MFPCMLLACLELNCFLFQFYQQLHRAATVAKISTASGGKFQAKLPKEKPARDIKSLMPIAPPPKKRKAVIVSIAFVLHASFGMQTVSVNAFFLIFQTPADEKKTTINIIDKILNKKPTLDIEAAVNRELFHQDTE